jgi:hypothetical protein
MITVPPAAKQLAAKPLTKLRITDANFAARLISSRSQLPGEPHGQAENEAKEDTTD